MYGHNRFSLFFGEKTYPCGSGGMGDGSRAMVVDCVGKTNLSHYDQKNVSTVEGDIFFIEIFFKIYNMYQKKSATMCIF